MNKVHVEVKTVVGEAFLKDCDSLEDAEYLADQIVRSGLKQMEKGKGGLIVSPYGVATVRVIVEEDKPKKTAPKAAEKKPEPKKTVGKKTAKKG